MVTLKQKHSGCHTSYMTRNLRIRKLKISDFFFSFKLRNTPDAYKWFHTNTPTTYLRHLSWFSQRLLFARDQTFVACTDRNRVGICYLSRQSVQDQCLVSISVSTSFRRTGIGEYLLRYITEVERNHGFKIFNASIHIDNVSSLALFRRVGFEADNNSHAVENFVSLKKTFV